MAGKADAAWAAQANEDGVVANGVRVVLADTPALLARVHRLRYAVYCLAKGFEDPDHQLLGMEQDRYDEFALQSLVMDEAGGDLGAVRLVLPNPAVGLPSFDLAPGLRRLSGDVLPSATTAEASRFLRAVHASGGKLGRAQEIMALMAAIVRMSARAGMTHVLALVTAPMLRLLGLYGVHFKPVAEPVAFNGLRYPAIFDLTLGLAQVRVERPEVWRILTAGGAFYAPLSQVSDPQPTASLRPARPSPQPAVTPGPDKPSIC